jgi:WD40 repeat protein
MDDQFLFDVFLSHSSKDNAVVRAVAERLRADGLRVWFDEWEIHPGDSIPAKIEEGIEHSRVLVLAMSENAFGADWPQLESGTFRFRDPLNRERRFIPLWLGGAPIKGALAQFLYINWLPEHRDTEYPKLLDACRPLKVKPTPEQQAERERLQEKIFSSLGHAGPVCGVAFSPDGKFALSGSEDHSARLWDVETGACLRVLEGHSASVMSVAWSPDGRRIISGAEDDTLRLWDVKTGRCLRVLKGHSGNVLSVAWSPDGRRVVSGGADHTVRLWDVESGACLRMLEGRSDREGHSDRVLSVAWSPDGRRVASGAVDNTVRIWDVETGACLRVIKSLFVVHSVAWGPDGRRVISGADDRNVRLWDVETGACLRVLRGHSDRVLSVAWSPDGRRAISGAADNTVRAWDIESGACLRVLEGHSDRVWSVAWSPDGRRAISGACDNTVRIWDVETGACLRVLKGHSDKILSVAWSPDGRRAVSGAENGTVRLWDVETGASLGVLEGHSASVLSVAWSLDGRRALSGAKDNTVRVWDVESGACLRVLEDHYHSVLSVAWSPDGHRAVSGTEAISGTESDAVRIWDVETGACLRVFDSQFLSISILAWSPDGRRVISGDRDDTVRLWDVETGRCLRVLEGHSATVSSVAWSPDGHRAVSGAADKIVRLWDVDTGACLRVLESHSGNVLSVAWSPDGRRVVSGAADNTLRLWDVESGACLRVAEANLGGALSLAWRPDGCRALSGARNGVMRVWDLADFAISVFLPEEKAGTRERRFDEKGQVQYTNAKVLLIGESGAGKTGLSMRLALDRWEPTDSTVGAWATQWKLPVGSGDGFEREIWLWDFGGQADQRLIHQLYLEDTALAVLVFDGQKGELFETLGQWDLDLTRASRKPFTKLLAAGRVDTGGLRVSRNEVERFARERGFRNRLFETSAKDNTGCEELKQAILAGIDWENIPWRSSPLIFKRLKEEIVRLRDDGRVLMRFNELRDALRLRLAGTEAEFKDRELEAVVGLLAGPGVVLELKFGSWVLLQPERINAYAQAVIQTLREDEFERGCLYEERVLNGELRYRSSMQRLGPEEERFVLLAMHQTLVERGLCLREHTEKGPMLIFPSYYRRERLELVGQPAVLVSYRFNGFLDDIYATLVVRLHHTKPFQQDRLWRYAADFKTLTGGRQLGVKLTRRGDGAGELEVYFDPAIPVGEKIIFSRYVHEHLLQKGRDVARLRHYVCPHCGTPVGNREVAMERLGEWLQGTATQRAAGWLKKSGLGKPEFPTILCAKCEKRVPLWDDLEQYFAKPETQQRVRELQRQSALVLDSESQERALVGEVISTVALAGQICREFNVSDHGIDMEIEFKNDAGEASGCKVYLQLKSGDSYLHERKGGAETFTIKDERHARYWMAQAFPVLLVIRSSDGEVRWMEVRDWLKRATGDGRTPVEQIVFGGERFDVMSVRGWRDKALGGDSR